MDVVVGFGGYVLVFVYWVVCFEKLFLVIYE